MANAISVSVLKYGNEEFGTTLAAAQTMLLNSEHIIYGTNKETKMDVTHLHLVGKLDLQLESMFVLGM